MTVREGVNVAYFHIVRDMREEDRQARMAGHKFAETLEERIQYFEERIGLRPDHMELALWMHKNVLLPALGRTWDDEEAKDDLPRGVAEEDRWRFKDEEWDGLKDFQGNPWALEGMGGSLRKAQQGSQLDEPGRGEVKDTL